MSNPFWQAPRLCFQITAPDGQAANVELDQPFAVVGSDQRCDVVLTGRGVERRSFLFLATSRGIRCVVLSSASKNAGRILRVQPENPIRVGEHRLLVQGTTEELSQIEDAPSAEDTSLHAITWKTDGLRTFVRLQDESPLIVGRKSPSHVRLKDDRLSGVHCCLFRSGNELWAIDLKSGNGTLVGGKSVSAAPVELEKSVVLGEQRLHFVRLHTSDLVNQLDAELQSLTAESEDERRLRARVEQQLAENCSELASSQDALAATEASLRSVQSQLEHAQQQLERSETASQSAALEIKELAAEKQELSTQLVNATSAAEETQQQLATHIEKVAELESNESSMRLEMQSLHEQLAAAKSARDAADQARLTAIRELEEQIVALKSERDATQSEVDQELTTTREQMLTLQNELRHAKSLLESDAIRQKETELERLKAELATEREILRKLKLDHYVAVESKSEGDRSGFEIEDETCIASFDFQEILEEAMDGLPSIEEEA